MARGTPHQRLCHWLDRHTARGLSREAAALSNRTSRLQGPECVPLLGSTIAPQYAGIEAAAWGRI